ncbi:MAG: carboxylesterase/lipase family protein [Hyphomicrobiales bacterium]|nr:carboxylesterase/lipase family protein [Hyphomicrobiales bacterium]
MGEQANDAPIARISAGMLRGELRDNVLAFHAIPYAAPPVGALRFAAPQPIESWTGVRDASQRGPSAPQGPSRLDAVMGKSEFAQDEDCLTVTIWTPATDGGRRPVFVWLHGGAYQSGGGNQVFYDGGNLAAAGDMVVVSVSYRLGALGYLYLPEAEAKGAAPANRGLLDQLAALQWVQDNIAAFGGDPGNVTLAGQSAGGGSAFALLSIPQAQGLIHRAILQSAPSVMLDVEKAAAYSMRYHELAGVSQGDVDGLRDLPAERLVAIQRQLQMEIATKDARSIAFQMVRGVAPLDGLAGNIFASGNVKHIPLLIGSTLDEGHAWMAQDENLRAEMHFEPVQEIARNAFREDGSGLPAGRKDAAGSPWQLLSAILTWRVFERTVLEYAEMHRSSGGDVFAYRFDWRPTPDALFGACHCIEIPFVFDNLGFWPDAAMVSGCDPRSFQALARAMQDAWIGFARTGSPQTAALPHWPRWSGEETAVMVFNDDIHLEPAPSV